MAGMSMVEDAVGQENNLAGQVTASIPLFLIHEFYPRNHGFNQKSLTNMHWEVDKDGYVCLPPGPGLGVEVNEDVLEKLSKEPQKYRWPRATLKDGSVADY